MIKSSSQSSLTPSRSAKLRLTRGSSHFPESRVPESRVPESRVPESRVPTSPLPRLTFSHSLGMVALPFSRTRLGRHYAGFPVAIETPGICVKFCTYKRDNAVWNYFRTHFLDNLVPLLYSVYFGKIYRSIYLDPPVQIC